MAYAIYSWKNKHTQKKNPRKVENFATYDTIRAATVYDKIIC